MTVRAVPLAPVDRDLYSLHEEDEVTEIPRHEREGRNLRNALSARFPDWFVTGNVGIYWEPGNFTDYAAPDVFVVREPLPRPDPRVYLTFEDPPILFVAEIGSRSTQRADTGPKVETYQELVRAQEYLYADPPKGILRLWRMSATGYEEATREANGRLRSLALGLEFGLDERGWLRVYTLDGEPLPFHEELAKQAQEAGRRAAQEAQRRRRAERRAEAEAARRAELERELAALRARLDNEAPRDPN